MQSAADNYAKRIGANHITYPRDSGSSAVVQQLTSALGKWSAQQFDLEGTWSKMV